MKTSSDGSTQLYLNWHSKQPVDDRPTDSANPSLGFLSTLKSNSDVKLKVSILHALDGRWQRRGPDPMRAGQNIDREEKWHYHSLDKSAYEVEGSMDVLVNLDVQELAKLVTTGQWKSDASSEAESSAGYELEIHYYDTVSGNLLFSEYKWGGGGEIKKVTFKFKLGNAGGQVETQEAGITWGYGGSSTVGTPVPTTPSPVEKPPEIKFLDGLQEGLDYVGMVPLIGELADAVNVGIHLGRGNFKEAALSGLSMIPFADIAAKGGKMLMKGGKHLAKHGDEALDAVSNARKSAAKCVDGPNCFVRRHRSRDIPKGRDVCDIPTADRSRHITQCEDDRQELQLQDAPPASET